MRTQIYAPCIFISKHTAFPNSKGLSMAVGLLERG
jgi:hypothetical protein